MQSMMSVESVAEAVAQRVRRLPLDLQITFVEDWHEAAMTRLKVLENEAMRETQNDIDIKTGTFGRRTKCPLSAQ